MSSRVSGRPPRGQDGFTLIELLVVIAILGVLAGIVVFSVQGAGDKGESAAVETDARTIRTAQETFCHQNGRYATSTQELADARLLDGPSTYNHIVPTGSGSCNGTGYEIAQGQPLPDVDQSLVVGYKSDPWSSATSKLRFTRFGLDAGTCETLTKVGNDYSVGPRLASSWDLIDSGNNPSYPGNPTWRFHLRPGVTFHDGTPFTAQDVKYSMDRLFTLGDDFSAKLGADSTQLVAGDPLAVDITPQEANFRLPETLVHPTFGIIKNGTSPQTNPPTAADVQCTGPFKFDSYTQGSQLKVVRNDNYWGTKAKLREITFRFIGDATTRRGALEAGDIDVMFDVGRQQVATLRNNGNLNVVSAPTSYVFNLYMNLNGTDPAYNELQSPAVRRALAMSINRPEFVAQNWEQGVATVINTPSPQFILGSHASKIQGVGYDLDGARNLLDEDGWTCAGGAPGVHTPCGENEIRQKNGEALSLYMLSQTGNVEDPLLQDLRSRVRRAGIDIEIGTGTSPQRSTRKNQGLWDLDHTFPNQNDANPAFLLSLQWWSKSINPWVSCLAGTTPCGPWQQAGPAFDQLVEQAHASPTRDGAQSYAADAMKLLFDDEVKIIPIAGISRVYGLQKGVVGFTPPHPAESHISWTNVYLMTESVG